MKNEERKEGMGDGGQGEAGRGRGEEGLKSPGRHYLDYRDRCPAAAPLTFSAGWDGAPGLMRWLPRVVQVRRRRGRRRSMKTSKKVEEQNERRRRRRRRGRGNVNTYMK